MGQAGSNDGPPAERQRAERPDVSPLRRKRHNRGPTSTIRVPKVFPTKPCMLKQLRLERCKDLLLIEEEFLADITEQIKAKNAEAQREKDDDEDSDDLFAARMKKVDMLRGPSMSVYNLSEKIDEDHYIVTGEHDISLYTPMLSFVDKEKLSLDCPVLLSYRTNLIVGVLEEDTNAAVEVMKVEKAPTESYADIGGLEEQVQEIKEAVEFPLTHPELYEEIGIRPPKGVILYGVPGTGKTLLAKAVANQTSATFLRVVGSELVQMYSGEGPKLVRELFRVAAENAPSIVFIDEVDAIGTKRYDTTSSGRKEVQRTMLELLTQLDGFDSTDNVKVIMATNRIETLDPALIRPGRIDRKIEFPYPDEKTKKMIFDIHTAKMSLGPDVNLSEFINSKEQMSGADIKAICTEAGLLALRERRMKVTQDDFVKGKENVQYRKDRNNYSKFYL